MSTPLLVWWMQLLAEDAIALKLISVATRLQALFTQLNQQKTHLEGLV